MIYLPEAFIGTLRIGCTSATADALFTEPLLFAAHYAAVNGVVTWPESIQSRITAIRDRYEAHDAVLDLIDTLRNQVPRHCRPNWLAASPRGWNCTRPCVRPARPTVRPATGR